MSDIFGFGPSDGWDLLTPEQQRTIEEWEDAKMTDDNNTCPRCGGGIPNDERRGEYVGALSRYDNETYICSQCGTDEALFNWLWPNRALPPLNQKVSR